jgi:hypothetical protein
VGSPPSLFAVALSTGLETPIRPLRAGASALVLSAGALAGELSGVTVCCPYAVPSAVSGVSRIFATLSAPSMSLSSSRVPTLTWWPPAATPSSVTVELATPLAGAGVVAAVAGPATAASRAAAAAADRRGEGRTVVSKEPTGKADRRQGPPGFLCRVAGLSQFDHGPLELSVTHPSPSAAPPTPSLRR